jgi:hypothetical protein
MPVPNAYDIIRQKELETITFWITNIEIKVIRLDKEEANRRRFEIIER